jgi:hypothetical protein
LSIRGGGQSDSGSLGFDARADHLNPFLNLHLFGTYDLLDAGAGIGKINNQRYGAGLALSHTFPGMANIFAGSAFVNELGENFGHAYLGGEIKVTDYALISGSYGFGVGNEKRINLSGTQYILAESADWTKLGVVLVAQNGMKTNLYYYLTDPGNQNISGIEGELSYPLTESVTMGIKGSSDLTRKTGLDKNWTSYFFLTYAFGGQKGRYIDVALDNNSPVAYPMIIRRHKSASSSTSPSALAVSPANPSAIGCSTDTVMFTASGGTPPYSWSTSEGGTTNLTVTSATQAQWFDGSDNFCGSGGTVTITVKDSVGAATLATITVTGG